MRLWLTVYGELLSRGQNRVFLGFDIIPRWCVRYDVLFLQ